MINVNFYIIAGLLIMFFNFFMMFYVFFIRKDLIINHHGIHRFLTGASITALIVIICFVIAEYQARGYTMISSVTIFVVSLIQLLWAIWFLDQLFGSEQNTTDAIEAIVSVIEACDPNLEGHSLYVHNLAILFYQRLPIDYKLRINARNLGFAALLIDVGKLGIPRSIINKTGKLTPEEREIMKRHPEIGVKILSTVPAFDQVIEWVRYHHERVDGGGYYHLKGNEIPLESRLIAICDTYSALTMNRTYKATLTYEEAISEIRLAAGSQLDSDLVEIFASIPMASMDECKQDAMNKMKRFENENFR